MTDHEIEFWTSLGKQMRDRTGAQMPNVTTLHIPYIKSQKIGPAKNIVSSNSHPDIRNKHILKIAIKYF